MVKPQKQTIIDFIISCLKKAEDRKVILSKVVKKWQTNVRTFDRLLKIAKEQHSEAQELIKKELLELDKQNAIEERKSQIADELERKEILTKIMRGEIKLKKHIVCDGIIQEKEVVPDWTDRKNAIAELNKMEGAYEPIKSKVEVTGNVIPDLSNLSFEQLEKLANGGK